MPMIDVAMPTISAGKCQDGSVGLGQAMAPRKQHADDREQIADRLSSRRRRRREL